MLFLNIEDLSIFVIKSLARATMYDTFFFLIFWSPLFQFHPYLINKKQLAFN